ncbi:DUF4190 domain-containing protein [Nocardioides sp. HM23]|uniref:DUF4190 domain-containing protein n=1 Tax=Nocardioides bizhenqiangii TaxID=3095076 RepID=UPI002ACA2E7C|nr:DUF4190 domain-containing protein [Nocardioides sp. HM23]MDZ5622788.1 DUF4190 domain-containing protein [Nocardioides sp. HM23]
MTDQPGLTPPRPPDEPASPPWGAAPLPPPPPPPPPAYGVPAQYQQVTGQQTHQGALWSMILGIVGLVSAILSLPTGGLTAPGMVCSPVAFGVGLWASKAVRNRPDLYNNRGQAIAGWIMGLIGILLAVLALLLVLAFFGLLIWLFAGAEQ